MLIDVRYNSDSDRVLQRAVRPCVHRESHAHFLMDCSIYILPPYPGYFRVQLTPSDVRLRISISSNS
ncbi:hypothetical protein EVAR_68271_1 [Eumeta japonica]|uniref:Uncharacterized protein n=1 Tax=Eumeta variegata TaxID=151549 RepID=A0A4C1SJH4_EUMVA|nr:hypothetical protein EVAR_68271_1 [Eumeta japonica]